MKLKSVLQMWLQKSWEKAIHVDLFHRISATQNSITLLLYILSQMPLWGFFQHFCHPGLSLPWHNVVLHHISSIKSHLAKTSVIYCFQSCICIIAFLSGVCVLEFMLTDNNQLPFLLNDLPRYQIGWNSALCFPVFLPAWDIYPYPGFGRVLAFQVAFTLSTPSWMTHLSNVPLKSQLYFTCCVDFTD